MGNTMFDRARAFDKAVGASRRRSVRVLLTGSADWLAGPTGQCLLLNIANLIPRLGARYGWVWVDDVTAEPAVRPELQFWGRGSVQDVALAHMARINPHGHYAPGCPTNPDIVIDIGGRERSGGGVIRLSADGWTGRMTSTPGPVWTPPSAFNPLGAIAAALLGAIRAYAVAEGLPSDDCLDWSCFDLSPTGTAGPLLPRTLTLGQWTLLGAGGVGSAFLHVLRHMEGITGDIDAVDHERASRPNLNRYEPMVWADAGKRKTDIAMAACAHVPGLRIHPHPCRIERWAGPWPDRVIVSTDSVASRLYAQDRLPELLLNVATGGTLVSISRYDKATLHVTGSLHDEYPGGGAALPRPVREGTACFVTGMAGLWAASEVLRIAIGAGSAVGPTRRAAGVFYMAGTHASPHARAKSEAIMPSEGPVPTQDPTEKAPRGRRAPPQ